MKRARGILHVLAATALAGAAVVAPASSGAAATTAGWGAWDPLTGSAGGWSTTMQLPAAGFPAAAMTSDSRGGVGVVSGASTWLAGTTPPGAVFGSSRDQAYVNLRPQADRTGSPSVTTYTFERPTPGGGWAFVLGDIDADSATVRALGADGEPLTSEELGWQGAFNYCQGAGTPSCTDTEVPTWNPATATLTGNATATDTNGASGWFRPTVPVTSLTIAFSWRSGFPVYQTWFASLARDVAGTVVLDDGGPLAGATLTLFGPDGTALATTTSGADGGYGFAGYAAAPGYRVELTTLPEASDDHPFGLVAQGPTTIGDLDLGSDDATGVDFTARDIEPIAVSGRVLDDDGNPVPGVTVTLTPAGGGTPFTAVTNSEGRYLVDDVPWDVGDPADPDDDQPLEYTFAVTDVPAGYTVTGTPDPITVGVDDTTPSTGNDVVLQGPASVTGTVTAGGEPVAGVVVTIDGPDGPVRTTTAADGTYAFAGVTAGARTVSVEAPDGYAPDGPDERAVTVGTDDVAGVDFALARPGAVGGTVTDDAGDPVAGATVTVEGPDGPVTLTTDGAGDYFLDDLPPGDHTITLTVPDGYTADVTERRVTVTAAGESFLAEDFGLVAEPVEPTVHPVSGAVSDSDGEPVAGAEVVVTDADGQEAASATTDDEGSWSAELPAGEYTATVTPPEGYVVDGDAAVEFTVDDAGVTGLDFVLAAEEASPTPSPDPSSPAPTPSSATPVDPGGGTAGGPGGLGALPVTGAAVGGAALGALLLVTAGGLALRASRRRARAEG
ncbi:carboxypeptidase regulatory-like domain-containing protein [Isoptericola sp. NPDC057653]|uniref:carboxypeptidase regulatory-like domain-containing protein n=1 Tax=Isoptericola sp. NPDC057653 TaxID=3346195 RepID=UPI0036CDF276